MLPLVSIIVPVYKVEKFLDECVSSIVSQTYKNLEIILVDDGSPDNCPSMCDKWAEKDERIRVIHKKNGGVSSARNMGLECAAGELICFVDSDDTVVRDYVFLLYNNMRDAELSIGNYYVDGEKENIDIKFYPGKYSLQQFKNDKKNILNYRLLNSPCNKLYRGDVIRMNNLRFDQTLTMGEDLVFNLDYMDLVEVISVFDHKIYNYTINDRSATKNYNPKYYEQRKYITKRMIDFFQLDEALDPINQICKVNLLLGLVNKEIIENPNRGADVATLFALLNDNQVIEEINKIRVSIVKMLVFWRNILALKYGLYGLYLCRLKKIMGEVQR